MIQSQLQNMIKNGENISVEFKKCPAELNHTVFETVCSFLNRTGGHLILGISDTGNILGVNVNCIDSMIKNFINTVNNPELLNPTFYFSPEVFTVENKKIIYIYIPESSQVHRYKGKVYDRVGDADNDITNNHYLINNIYLRKNREFTENEVLPFLEVADLNSDTFRKARQLAGVLNDNHPWLTMDNAEILHSCGLWRKDNQTGKEGYTLAAALLFGKENTVLSCCPAYKTDAIYRNMTYERFLHPLPSDPDVRYDDRDDIRVNLIEAYQRLITFINRNLPDKFHLEGIQRIDLRDKIFREIAANCLIHREFAHSFPAKFLVFSDRVITENWTKPVGQNPVTLDSLETHPKNPMIARVFKELGWVEELGSGRKNIRKYAPYYYIDYQLSIENEEKFVFTITYRDTDSNLENEHVNLENEHVNLESEQVKLESEQINSKNEQVKLESEQVNSESEQVKLENEQINSKSEQVNLENEQINSESEQIKLESEQINSIYELIETKITENINEPVKLSIFRIIAFLLNNNCADGNTLAIISGKGRSSLTRHLKLLRDANIIEFIGSDKTGEYFLTREAAEKLVQ